MDNSEDKIKNMLALAHQSQFISSISHELKNQLVGIISLSEVIKDELYGRLDENHKKEYLEAASDINKVSNEMMEFINDLMDPNQNQSGDFSINLEKVDVAAAIRYAIKINLNLAIQKQIKIEFNQTSALPRINLDPRRTKQVFINLISNAVKYSKEGTTININHDIKKAESKDVQLDTTAEPSDVAIRTCCQTSGLSHKDQLIISIKDQGIGMNEKEIEMALAGDGKKIDKSILQSPLDSHGIGMPLVKRLVELQGVSMEIKSELGSGTEVLLKFNI
jgi:two-component system cell cycle sensor histidine kinase PleC